jgi:hypothetical protein
MVAVLSDFSLSLSYKKAIASSIVIEYIVNIFASKALQNFFLKSFPLQVSQGTVHHMKNHFTLMEPSPLQVSRLTINIKEKMFGFSLLYLIVFSKYTILEYHHTP